MNVIPCSQTTTAMTSNINPPLVYREYKDQYRRRSQIPDQHRPRLPPIPDLRFELSYLRSIRPYIHILGSNTSSNIDEKDTNNAAAKEESIEVEWGHVLWVTARDQIMSPLFQGALW